jgi:hypothetical protein
MYTNYTGADWDRLDICPAYQALENDWNVGGWLPERPSCRRRMESVGVQLHRMKFHAGLDGAPSPLWATTPRRSTSTASSTSA